MNYTTFHWGLHCFLKSKQPSGTEIHNNFRKKYTCDPLKYIMDSPILILPICMGKSIRIQRGLMFVFLSWVTDFKRSHLYVHAIDRKYHFYLRIYIESGRCNKVYSRYLDSVPSLTFNTIQTELIMYTFHSSRYLQSKCMFNLSHASIIKN